jgi:AraC family transcriptional regulator
MNTMTRGAITDAGDAIRSAVAELYSLCRHSVNEESSERSGVPIGTLLRWQRLRLSEYIEANIGETLRVPDLGGVVRLSAGHFSRVFKRSFGRSPHAYIMQRRVASAMILMLQGAQPLCDIAAECGFADQSHLSRAFRRWADMSPSAWRQQHTATSH